MTYYVHAAVEVHSIDTDCRIILDSQIDVLADTEAKVARFTEVLLSQFVFFYFETALEYFFCFWTSNSDMDLAN